MALFGVDDVRPRVPELYAVDDPRLARARFAKALAKLAPGGRLDVVDFGQQERLPRWFRGVLFAWLAKFDVAPRPDLLAAIDEIAPRAQHHAALSWLCLERASFP